MTPALRVDSPGLHTTVQDVGRRGFQHAGVPVSGALDPVALALTNLLVGNADDMAGLEVLYQGPTFTIDADGVRIAAVGAKIDILGDDKHSIPPFCSVSVRRGTQVRISVLPGTATAMIAVEGGFAIKPVLGSLSTYVRAGLGGFDGRALREGDCLPLAKSAPQSRGELHVQRPALPTPEVIRVLPGPQVDYFDEATFASFLSSTYVVSQASDRMGMRLEGHKLVHAKAPEIVSDGIAHGAIQVPGSGLPIILLADRQTTGGYPKIAVVISADLPALGRLAPGAKVRFESVTGEEALQARRKAQDELKRMIREIGPVGARLPSESDLLTQNLVSGVVSAEEC